MSVKQAAESYLTFKLGDELFAVNVSKVLEILEIIPITKVPKSPPFMKGVVNLRGNILPVIDMLNKFEMADTAFTIDTCIIVLNINTGEEQLLAGALVDSVQEVIEISEDNIQPSPTIVTSYKEEFIKGMGKVGEGFVMILDIDKVFSADELHSIITED